MKKLIKIVLYCLFLVLLIEFAIGRFGYRLTQGKPYSYEELAQERHELISANLVSERAAAEIDQVPTATQKERKRRTEILHPYLGFVVDSHDDECPDIG
ncbi:hypothetical protein VU06_01905, partial [Desulfobulbus sp. F3]|nr:hypothetical protein [Desulfobulbus sp. F3]